MNHKIVCPVLQTIAMVSDKWKVLILYHLRDGKRRFSELRRSLQGVTQRVLTHQLRALEDDGLVTRHVYAEVPPRVEYELTRLGRTLIPVLDKFEEWARENSEELMAIKGFKGEFSQGLCSGDAAGAFELSASEPLAEEKEYTPNSA